MTTKQSNIVESTEEKEFKERTFTNEEITILQEALPIESPCISCNLTDLSRTCNNCQEEKDFFSIYKHVQEFDLELYDNALHNCIKHLNDALKSLKDYKKIKDSLPEDLKIFSFEERLEKIKEELKTV